MTKKRTIRLRQITVEQFEAHFILDSLGYFIARDAVKAGEIGNAVDALEALCLTNELYQSELLNRLLIEIEPSGRLDEYIEKQGTDAGTDLVMEVLGKGRATDILREVMQEVKRIAAIATDETPAQPAGRRRSTTRPA